MNGKNCWKQRKGKGKGVWLPRILPVKRFPFSSAIVLGAPGVLPGYGKWVMHTSPVGDGKNFLLANPLHVSKKKSPGNWLVG